MVPAGVDSLHTGWRHISLHSTRSGVAKLSGTKSVYKLSTAGGSVASWVS